MNNPVLKTMVCGASSVAQKVDLHQNEWQHTKNQHVEVDMDHLTNAIEQPARIYRSHTTPRSVLFAGSGINPATQHPIRVAVKVIAPDQNFVATAWYSSDPFKGQLIWVGDVSGASLKIESAYDDYADVLYVSAGEKKPAVSKEDEDGLIWRYVSPSDRPYAVTVLDFKEFWVAQRAKLVTKVATGLDITGPAAESLIPTT